MDVNLAGLMVAMKVACSVEMRVYGLAVALAAWWVALKADEWGFEMAVL